MQWKLEAIQRWSAICRVWPWTLTYQKFLLCISSQGQNLYSHQKLNMYIYCFSSESGHTPPTTTTTPDATIQPLGRHIANNNWTVLIYYLSSQHLHPSKWSASLSTVLSALRKLRYIPVAVRRKGLLGLYVVYVVQLHDVYRCSS